MFVFHKNQLSVLMLCLSFTHNPFNANLRETNKKKQNTHLGAVFYALLKLEKLWLFSAHFFTAWCWLDMSKQKTQKASLEDFRTPHSTQSKLPLLRNLAWHRPDCSCKNRPGQQIENTNPCYSKTRNERLPEHASTHPGQMEEHALSPSDFCTVHNQVKHDPEDCKACQEQANKHPSNSNRPPDGYNFFRGKSCIHKWPLLDNQRISHCQGYETTGLASKQLANMNFQSDNAPLIEGTKAIERATRQSNWT